MIWMDGDNWFEEIGRAKMGLKLKRKGVEKGVEKGGGEERGEERGKGRWRWRRRQRRDCEVKRTRHRECQHTSESGTGS